MKIGIIGSGNIGGILARKLRKLNYSLSLTNSRGPQSLKEFADETGVIPANLTELVEQSDLIVVTIPQKSIPALPAGLFKNSKDKIVIDTCNYYPDLRDGRLSGYSEFTIDSDWVEEQLGHAVIKVFNSIAATSLQDKGLPKGSSGRIGLPIAGDVVGVGGGKGDDLCVGEHLDEFEAGGTDEALADLGFVLTHGFADEEYGFR